MTQRAWVRLWQFVTLASGAWFLWEWLIRSHYGHMGVAFGLTAWAWWRLEIARIEKTVINSPYGTTIYRDRNAQNRGSIRE